ncbi:MAG TPA: hypothetical protein VK363_09180 [Pyrinomonadaceae bacterium]|nr:hypothetical protein [Pyrinomonadaceae bacterium]
MSERLRLFVQRRPLLAEACAAPLALAALYLLVFGAYLKGDRSVSTFLDNTYLIHPIFHHISASFARGEFPYWINTIVGGLPLYNTPQFSLTYPFYFFHAGLYADAANISLQVHYVTFLHLFIAYVNSYVLMRVLRLAPLHALLGASLFAFSANTFEYSTWVNIAAPYSWFPLVVASFILILEERRRGAAVLLGAASLGLLALASTSQPLIHLIVVMLVLYLAHAFVRVKRGEFRALARTTFYLVLMGGLGLMLAAPSVFPVVADTGQMIRFIGSAPAVVGFAPLPFKAFLEGQLHPVALAGTLLPLDVHRVMGNSFVGLGAVLLALFGVLRGRSHWVVLPFLFIALYGLLSATGDHLGVARFNYQLPLINKIREPPRHLFLFVLGISVLAAHGFAYLTERLGRGYRATFNLGACAAAFVFVILLLLTLKAGLPYAGTVPKELLLAALAAVVVLLLMLPLVRRAWARGLVTSLIVLLVVASALPYSRIVLPLREGDYFAAENLNSHRTLTELAQIADARDYRFIIQDDKLKPVLWSMNAGYYGLRTFQGYMNPLPYAQFQQIYQRFNLRNYYPMLGGKYYLCNPCNEALLGDYDFQREVNGYRLHVARRPMPRFALVNRLAGTYESPNDFYNKIHAGYDYTKELYVGTNNSEYVASWLGVQSAHAASDVKAERASLNAIRLSVNAPSRAVLVFNEHFEKAWKARVNGAPARLFRVNLNQIGVRLEGGASTIDFEYRPTLFIRSLWLQRATFAGMLLAALYLMIAARRSSNGGRNRLRIPEHAPV